LLGAKHSWLTLDFHVVERRAKIPETLPQNRSRNLRMKALWFQLRSAIPRAVAIGALLGLAACATEHHSRHGAPPGDETAEAPTPAMAATGSFFTGQIAIEVLLNRAGFGAGKSDGAGDGGNQDGPGGGGGRRGRHGRRSAPS
jgi:hypothetical protein